VVDLGALSALVEFALDTCLNGDDSCFIGEMFSFCTAFTVKRGLMIGVLCDFGANDSGAEDLHDIKFT